MFHAFRELLEARAPGLLPFVFDVGSKFDGSYGIDADDKTFRIEVGFDEILLIVGLHHGHYLDHAEDVEELLQTALGYLKEERVMQAVFDENGAWRTCVVPAGSLDAVPPGGSQLIRSFKGTYDEGDWNAEAPGASDAGRF